MFGNYVFIKILIILLLIGIVGFALIYLIKFLIKFIGGKKTEPRVEEMNINIDSKNIDQEIVQIRVEFMKLSNELWSSYQGAIKLIDKKNEEIKQYQDGIFYANNKKLFNDITLAYENIERLKRGSIFTTEDQRDEIEFLAEDLLKLLRHLNIDILTTRIGAEFDFNVMEVAEGGEVAPSKDLKNKVCEVVSMGYLLHLSSSENKVLKPVKVRLYK